MGMQRKALASFQVAASSERIQISGERYPKDKNGKFPDVDFERVPNKMWFDHSETSLWNTRLVIKEFI